MRRASEFVARVIHIFSSSIDFLLPFSTSSHMVSHPPDLHEPHWHHLPVEIVKRIFELAATSARTAFVLCVVSRTVFEWTIPVLYQTIAIREHRDLVKFTAAIKARAQKDCYHHTIKNLYVPMHMRVSIPPEFLSLQQLCFSPLTTQRPGHYPPFPHLPSLTHLTVYEPQDCFFPFQSITHLFIADKEQMTHHLPTFLSQDRVPHLTHFVCHILTKELTWIDDGLRRLFTWLHGFEKLQVVGLAPVTFKARWLEPDPSVRLRPLLQRLGHEGHPKLVLLPIVFDVTVWEDWCRGKENIWELAERLLLEQHHESSLL